MFIRNFEPLRDFGVVANWWKHWKFPPIPRHALPVNGFIVEDGKPILAGFLYLTDSPISLLEWVTANPDTTKEQRAAAIDLMVTEASNTAQRNGRTAITLFTGPDNQTWVKRLESNGFKIANPKMIMMMKTLKTQQEV